MSRFKLKNKQPFSLSLGKRGEMLAAAYLHDQKYKILEKNYRCSIGELDLVTELNGKLRFVEVKTRSSAQYGFPEEAVGEKKQHKIRQLALSYLKEKNKENISVAFDVVSILWHPKKEAEFKLIQDAF
jgi:putative endonuclease